MPNKRVTLLVNGEEIARSNLDKERLVLRRGYAELFMDGDPGKLEERIEKDARENVVERFLMLREASKLGLIPSRTQIEARFQEDRKRYGLKKEDVDPDLASKAKADTADQLATEMYMKSVCRDVARPTDADCLAHYNGNKDEARVPERVHGLQILLSPGPGQSASAVYNKLKEVRLAVREGADFKQMIRAFSSGQEDEGDLGFFARGELPFGVTFDNLVFSIPVQEVTDVISSEFGFHLVKIIERIPEKILSFEEAKEGIYDALFEERKEEQLSRVLDGLKLEVEVEVREEEVREET